MTATMNCTLYTLSEDELLTVTGGFGIVNFVGGVVAIAGVAGAAFPPLYAVALIGGAFLVGYGLAQ